MSRGNGELLEIDVTAPSTAADIELIELLEENTRLASENEQLWTENIRLREFLERALPKLDEARAATEELEEAQTNADRLAIEAQASGEQLEAARSTAEQLAAEAQATAAELKSAREEARSVADLLDEALARLRGS